MPTASPTPIRPFASCHDHMKRRTCMLMVTHGCNLNCTYCYEKFKNGAKRMSIDLAKEIILKEIEIVKADERFEELEVDFMGGEPLLRFDLIKEVVVWMEQSCDIPFICFASTNGTLLTSTMKDWLKQHSRAIVLGISYDGMEDSQCLNRGENSCSLDLDFFSATWPFQPLKMTISKASLPHLYESFVLAHKNNYDLSASLAQGINWDAQDARVFKEQLMSLKDFYLANPEYTPCDFLTRPLTHVGSREMLRSKFCGSGTYMATYDTDGALYGCHMFTPLVLGNKAMKREDFDGWDDDHALTDKSCIGCGF